MNQNQSKYCKNQEHCNQTIRFLCLQQNCANDRLICHYCIRDRHRKHSIANLEKYIDPLARLGMNSAFPQREKYINAFQNSIISLTESSDKINELVNNQTRLIKENLIDQMAIISQTFSDDLVESASNKMSQGLATEQQVEEYVKMINLLGRKDFNDPQKLMELLNSINKQISNSLQQAYKKINNIFLQLQAKIHKYNFSNQNVDEVLNENKQKLHPYIQNIQKPKKSESAKKIQTINTIKDPSHVIIENTNKESSEEPLTKVEYQELYMNNYQIQIGLQVQDGILTMKNQAKSKVKRVIVTCCKNPQAQLLKILSLPHLQELYICWYELAKKQYLIRIINNCSNLKVFVLNCANEFDQECCRLIPKRLPRIRKLQYGWDFFGSMREYDDNIYFRLSPYTNRGCPLKTSITREMVVGLKKLETVWLGDFMYFRPSNNEIPFKNIKQFTLGQTKGKYFRIPQKLCIQLKNMRQLLSLSILHVKIDQKKLHPILMNNPFIKTFLVQGCDDITDQSLKILAKNCNLTHLSIRQSRSIQATPVWQMQNLTTLILVECNRVKAELAIKGLQKMKYLSYLNLYGNKWVNDELVKRIPNHDNCHTLNLGRTSISDNSLQELKSMKKLKVLCIDCNKLSGMAISKLASSINFLQKLSLWGLDGELDSGYISNQDLQLLAKELTCLKHLSIRYCKQLNAEIFLKFKVLKFIQTDKQNLTLQVGSQLQKRGVKIILDLQKGIQQEV